jgi:hypothetical protein
LAIRTQMIIDLQAQWWHANEITSLPESFG